MGSKYEQIKKQKIGYRGRKGGGRKEEIVPLSNSAFRGFENKRLERNRELDKKNLSKEEVAEIEREIRGEEANTVEEDAAEKREQHKRQNEETDNNDEEEEREKDKAERFYQREENRKNVRQKLRK